MTKGLERSLIALIATLLSGFVHATEDDLANLKSADAAWNEAAQSRSSERIAEFYTNEAIADFGPPGPIRSKVTIAQHWSRLFSNPKYSIHWKLESAAIVDGGELGYTIGRWFEESGKGPPSGPYVAVWRKQPDGRWLVLIDTASNG